MRSSLPDGTQCATHLLSPPRPPLAARKPHQLAQSNDGDAGTVNNPHSCVLASAPARYAAVADGLLILDQIARRDAQSAQAWLCLGKVRMRARVARWNGQLC